MSREPSEWFNRQCPRCNGVMRQTMWGKWLCPSCTGKEIARKAFEGIKLDFRLKEANR